MDGADTIQITAGSDYLSDFRILSFRSNFVLRWEWTAGSTLFLIWQGKLARPTRDVDFLAYGSPDIDEVTKSIREICSAVADDGIIFDLEKIRGEAIREEAGEFRGGHGI